MQIKFNSIASLKRRYRPIEFVIQAFLFSSAALSIFVTLGIVYELGKESLLFFTADQWRDTNATIVSAVEVADTELQTSTTGSEFEPGMVVRLGEEKIYVEAVDGERLSVVRGYENTTPEFHHEGRQLWESLTPTLREFLGTTEWIPQLGKFGIWALANATLITSLTAILVALPLGLSVAIYLSEYASERARKTLKPILELLAGIPTVVYGYFALTFMTPLLRSVFGGQVEIYNTASAGIVIGILILPLVSSMAEDALSAVPRTLREGAYALGATKFETAVRVVVPAAISGIAAAFIVAASRAIGETMVVAIAAGAGPNFTFNPFKAAETMTGHIVRISGGDISYDSIDYNSIFAVGLTLFLITLVLNIFSQYIVNRFREEYE